MDTSQARQMGGTIRTLRPRQMGALPLIDPILSALQVRQRTNDLVAGQAEIEPGRMVLLLTLNRLSAPQPLYRVVDWLGETVLPEVLDIPPGKVYDNQLGRALLCLTPVSSVENKLRAAVSGA